jgi:flagellar basal-body rod protein FlgF
MAPDGTLVSLAGQQILSDAGAPIVIPENTRDITIAQDGSVIADGNPVGVLGVTRFGADSGFIREANGLFTSTGQGQPAAGARVHQGMTERSNVEPMREMIAMMELSKQYEQARQMIDGEDDRTRKAIDRIARPL